MSFNSRVDAQVWAIPCTVYTAGGLKTMEKWGSVAFYAFEPESFGRAL